MGINYSEIGLINREFSLQEDGILVKDKQQYLIPYKDILHASLTNMRSSTFYEALKYTIVSLLVSFLCLRLFDLDPLMSFLPMVYGIAFTCLLIMSFTFKKRRNISIRFQNNMVLNISDTNKSFLYFANSLMKKLEDFKEAAQCQFES